MFMIGSGDIDPLLGTTWVVNSWSGPTIEPGVDVIEYDDKYSIIVEAPGIKDKNKDIEISVENDGKILIDVKKEYDYVNSDDAKVISSSIFKGNISKAIYLDNAVIDPDKIKATYKNGVLEINVPKSKPKSRTVRIN